LSEKTDSEKNSSVFQGLEFFIDLVVIGVWLAAGIWTIYLSNPDILPLRYVLTLPIIFIIPGYGAIAALFPKKNDMRYLEKILLSMGFSIAIVSLIGLGLNFTAWGIRLDPIIISLALFTLSMLIVAIYRRFKLPVEERFSVPLHAFGNTIHGGTVVPKEKKTDRFLSAVLILVIVVAIITLFSVIVFPQEGEQFTEFFILNENQTAGNFPDRIIVGQDYPMFVGIGDHESGDTHYTVETWTQLTEFDTMTNSSHILVMDPNDRLSATLANNQTIIIPYNVSVRKSGYNRIEFLLFKNGVPGPDVVGSDRINASYRNVNIWFETIDQEAVIPENIVQ
jgi:uncharacterized membrane protein